MATDISPSPSPSMDEIFRRKHGRSPEEDWEEEGDGELSRRRKRHNRDWDAAEEPDKGSVPVAMVSNLPRVLPVDDEREEGEIVEDDEGVENFLDSDHLVVASVGPLEDRGMLDTVVDDGNPVVSGIGNSESKAGSREAAYEVFADKRMVPVEVREISGEGPLGDIESSVAERDSGSRRSSRNESDGYVELDKKTLGGVIDSRSPACQENEDSTSRKHNEDHEQRSQREVGSNDARWSALENGKRSVSPEGGRDGYVLREHSPSYKEYRERSRSCEPREGCHQRDHRSSRASSLDVLEKTRSDSDHERGLLNRSEESRDARRGTKDMANDRVSRRERERSSSHSRHNGLKERHCGRETYGEKDRDRGSDVGDLERMRDVIREKERERDRERERRRSREHSEDYERERLRGRERERERGRDRDRDHKKERVQDRERERDRSMDRVRHREKERERSKEERDRERRFRDDRGNGWDRARDKERDRERERDRDREMERERERDLRRERDRGSSMPVERGGSRDRDSRRDSRYSKYDETKYQRDRSKAKQPERQKHDYGVEKKSVREEEEEDYHEKIELQLAEQEEEDLEKIIEESRRRRQAILEKYKQQQLQQQLQSDNQHKESPLGPAEGTNAINNLAIPAQPEGKEDKRVSSEDYVVDPSFSVGKSPQKNGTAVPEKSVACGLGHGTPKSDKSADMFSDDIFGESPAGARKLGKGEDKVVDRSGAHDNWDDAEGYYIHRLGEFLDVRYEIIASHGKGVFSTVVRAKDLKAGKGEPLEVAIKIIRNNDTMFKAGLEELVILNKLAGADPEDRRHCVRFLSSFKYRNHLCLVFESLHMNLREVLKKFGRNIGLKLTAVRAYAKQLFIALKHLRNCGVLHCDIKPDNMLVNEAKNVLKLCDFGNAMFAGKNEITPYLVSRFYRAPEIILGLPYDHPMDIWSVGCCLFELYSGKVLFPGATNNDMLRLHMELKGPFPKKMLRKGAFSDRHFDQDMNFHSTDEDPVTKKTIKKILLNIKPKDIGTLLGSFPEEDPKMLAHFKDLLERIFVLDPDKRLTVSQALSHSFITGK